MRRLHAWMMILVAWGYTWLALSSVSLLAAWNQAAGFAAEGALVAFSLALASAALGLLFVFGRLLVERRLEAAGTAFHPPQL